MPVWTVTETLTPERGERGPGLPGTVTWANIKGLPSWCPDSGPGTGLSFKGTTGAPLSCRWPSGGCQLQLPGTQVQLRGAWRPSWERWSPAGGRNPQNKAGALLS